MIYDDFVKWLSRLDLSTVDANPISFKLIDFESSEDFTKSMILSGRYFFNEKDIVVRYSKPFTEDGKDVIVQFQILRSKAKMFFNYFNSNKNTYPKRISCFLTSNKEYKEFIKFFNSLGVKDEDGNSISNYASTFKEIVEETKKTVGEGYETYMYVSIRLKRDNEDNEYLAMTYAPILKENVKKRIEQCRAYWEYSRCGMYLEIKEYVKKKILKIEE